MGKTKKKLIGYVAVDTGRVVIADPLFAADAAVEVDEEANYVDVENPDVRQLTGESAGHTFYQKQMAVVCSTGLGDGFYPAFAHYTEDGLVARITIEFL